MLEKIPPSFNVRGRAWTAEALIIAALMRRLKVTEVDLTPSEMAEPTGMIINQTSSKVTLVKFSEK